MSHTEKQLAAELLRLKNSEQEGREGFMHLISAESKERKWTEAQLEKDGSARVFLRETLRIYHDLPTIDAVNAPELSRFCTVAHPACRGKMTAILTNAEELASQHGERRDNVAMKLMKHLKSTEGVSTVESAAEHAAADYADKAAKKAAAPSVNTVDGFIKIMCDRLATANAKKLFTADSLALATEALRALEARPVETPAPSTDDDGDIADILGNFSPEQKQALAALLLGK